jgi:hypothetical protein
VTFSNEAKQDVLSANNAVVELVSFFLGQNEDPPRPVGEAFEHRATSSQTERDASSR